MQSGSFVVFCRNRSITTEGNWKLLKFSWMKQTSKRVGDATSIWIEIGATLGVDTVCEENDGQLVGLVDQQRGAGEAGMPVCIVAGQIAHKIGGGNHPTQSKRFVGVWMLD